MSIVLCEVDVCEDCELLKDLAGPGSYKYNAKGGGRGNPVGRPDSALVPELVSWQKWLHERDKRFDIEADDSLFEFGLTCEFMPFRQCDGLPIGTGTYLHCHPSVLGPGPG